MANPLTDVQGESELVKAIFGFFYPDGFRLTEEGVIAVHLMLREFHAEMLNCRVGGNVNGNWRLQRVLRQRFGIGCRKHTLSEVALTLYNVNTATRGVNRERVRNLEGTALRKLRSPHFSRQLKPYLPNFDE